ncbi:hypothetical protein SSYRP_v1c00900 [Spiroplasma syrphidicola EA-1]|uniref:2-oxoacid dehydrogenase acyltransferase catalytic domain-containing protein n=1 Tax=Spiroplasma syrphidicola EA-1 TaxID=1276229 RepID=R4UK92_9MOLU|nr:2-oxo acid dehydrogenase subunit E2 [Spiroplasma syrphidicola]AGM25686.1 hypothetical protein SSYRP_v1c00900 [Spiroplasma syrphidicola EA-1]
MKKIRIENLSQKGVLERFLYTNDVVQAGEPIALILVNNKEEVIVNAPDDGLVIKPIKIGSKVKNNSVIAHLLTNEKEITKYHNKLNKKSDFEVDFSPSDKGEFGTKWADVEEDDYSGTSFVSTTQRMPGQTLPLTSLLQTPNPSQPQTPAYQSLLDKVQEPRPEVTLEQKSEETKSIFNAPYAPLKTSIVEKSRWDEKPLSFNKPSEKPLSFKEATRSESFLNQKSNSEESTRVEDLKAKISQALAESKNTLQQELAEKEYAKYLVETTKTPDEKPASAILASDQTETAPTNNFRELVNKRREQLHSNNNFQKLNLEADNSKNAMDFLDDEGKPVILRNIVQNRMNNLISENTSGLRATSEAGGVSFSDPSDNYRGSRSEYGMAPSKKTSDNADKYSYINADGILVEGDEPEHVQHKQYKTYRDRLFEKLHNDTERQKILKTRNQRELIKQRMEAIAAGDVEVDNVLGAMHNFKRPSYEEMEKQYKALDDKYNAEHSEFDHPDEDYVWGEQITHNEPIKQSEKLQSNPKVAPVTAIKESQPVVQQFLPPQSTGADSTILAELAVLKEKLAQQEQNNRQNELLNEIRHLKENNQNNNSNNTFDKLMQYMMLQQMFKSAPNSGTDPVLADLLKESFLGNKTNNNQDLQIKKFDNMAPQGNLLHPINNSLNIVNTSDNIVEPQGTESREEIKTAKYPAIKSMIMAQASVPPLTINTEIDMSAVIEQQRKLKNANANTGVRFSTMSFIVKSVSLALTEYPKLNSYYDARTNQIVIKNSHHIGIATETSEGLVIPVIKFAEKLSLKQIAVTSQEIIDRLREGELYDYELQGSTITVANYGTVGAVTATPTIFYPNSAVVGIGRVVRKPVVIKGDKLVIRSMMNISLTIDQRIIDAAEAGIFLTRLKEILESPELITLS